MLTASCACHNSPADVERMTDRDLKRALKGENRFLENAVKVLKIEENERIIMPGSPMGRPAYRFRVGDRFLFFDVDIRNSNIVTRAFFSNPIKPTEPESYRKFEDTRAPRK